MLLGVLGVSKVTDKYFLQIVFHEFYAYILDITLYIRVSTHLNEIVVDTKDIYRHTCHNVIFFVSQLWKKHTVPKLHQFTFVSKIW